MHLCPQSIVSWANRTRLPELDQEAIQVQPLLRTLFSNRSPDVGKGLGEGQVVRHVDRDLSKISMFQ
jgi:hypothetical protein